MSWLLMQWGSIMSVPLNSAKAIAIAVLTGALALGETTQAQVPDAPPVAVAQDLRAAGEALIFGLDGVQVDIPAGVALLERAAGAGDVAAQASLGKILLDGYYVEAEAERGLAFLEAAAAAGNTRARTTLGIALLWGTGAEANPDRALELLKAAAEAGDAHARATLGGVYLWGTGADADPERARDLLQSAADAGDPEAQRVLGEQLIGGWIYPRDVPAGKALLEGAISTGDAAARVSLGDFMLYGIGLPKDQSGALELYEAAAAQGKGAGIEHYGEAMMWSERDPAAAEAYLVRAGELGRGSAWSILAEGAMYGYLGGGATSRRKFDLYAEKAREAGNARIEVLDATRQMWGISMRASGPLTLERLRSAAEAGNAEAAGFLIGLLRDGNRLNIRRDRDAARTALERYGELLGPLDVARYGYTIDASKARYPGAYAEAAETLAAHPDWMDDWFARELYDANPNVAIYVLQQRFKAEGLYGGALDGLVGPRTLRALNIACRDLDPPAACDDSVLRPDVIGALLAL